MKILNKVFFIHIIRLIRCRLKREEKNLILLVFSHFFTFPIVNLRTTILLPSKFNENMFSRYALKSVFLLLHVGNLRNELFSYRKSCWLVFRSCSMLWKWFVLRIHPPLALFATGEK